MLLLVSRQEDLNDGKQREHLRESHSCPWTRFLAIDESYMALVMEHVHVESESEEMQ